MVQIACALQLLKASNASLYLFVWIRSCCSDVHDLDDIHVLHLPCSEGTPLAVKWRNLLEYLAQLERLCVLTSRSRGRAVYPSGTPTFWRISESGQGKAGGSIPADIDFNTVGQKNLPPRESR